MKKLGDQWVEIGVDELEHMYKASANNANKEFDCTGCIFNDNRGNCCYKNQDCPVGSCAIVVIKDLGILRNGHLPCPFCGEYPVVDREINTAYCNNCGYEIDLEKWNRRS